MSAKPRFTLREAAARFFPTSTTGYDFVQGDRVIRWLESCGYEIVPRESRPSLVPDDSHEHETQSASV